jgi:hypothetical protein
VFALLRVSLKAQDLGDARNAGGYVIWLRTLAVFTFVAVLSANARAQSAVRGGLPDEAWWEDPCIAIEPTGEPTGTRVALDALSFLAPPGLRVSSRQMFEIELRDGQARVRMRLAPDGSALYREYDLVGLRYRYCQDEVAGRMAEAFSFRQGWLHGFAARWPDVYRDEWLSIVILSPTREKTGQLRRLLSTIEFPK